MKHLNTQALYEYWNTLRAGRIAPYRGEIDPRAIAPLLESTFILEHLSATNIRFRLAGTRLCESFGMELRGMSALTLWQGECRTQVSDIIQKVISEPCIGYVTCSVETRSGYLFNAEFLYLPLRSDFGDISRVLGCGYYMGKEQKSYGLCEPVHHWVDAVDTYAIAVDIVDSPLTMQITDVPGVVPSPNHNSDMLDLFGPTPEDTPSQTPYLQAIEGGASLRLPSTRDRTHLKLIKSDVG